MKVAVVLQRGVATSYIVYTATVLSAASVRRYIITVGSQTRFVRLKKTIRYVGMTNLAGESRLEMTGELRTLVGV